MIFMATCLQVTAQRSSIYSRFGIGNMYSQEYAPQKAMGQLDAAYNNEYETNYANPATYGLKKFTSLDLGLGVNLESFRDQNFSDQQTSGQFSYFSYSFPLNKNKTWGLGFGLQPVSWKDYDVTADVINNTFFRQFSGEGNTYKAFLGTGVAIGDLLLGLESGLHFGHLEDNTYNTFLDISEVSTAQTLDQRIRGVVLKPGFQYRADINEDMKFTIGGTYAMETKINNRISENEFSFRPVFITSGSVEVQNRLLLQTFVDQTTDTEFDLPATFSGGVFVEKTNKWSLGADVKTQGWDDFSGINNNGANVDYQNSVDVSLGGSFIPNYRNPSKFYESFQYRYGGRYSTSYLNLGGESINEFGITLGVGIPNKLNTRNIHERSSYTSIALDIGQRGTTSNNLVQETFVKTTIGVNLNDIWFRKRRYD